MSVSTQNAAGVPRGSHALPPAPQTVPAAASPRVAAALHGPDRTAEVVGCGPHATYVRDGDTVLAVLTRAAVAVPCGLRTRLARVAPANTVRLGAGRCVLGDRVLRVCRLVDTSAPVTGPLGAGSCPDDARLDAVRDALPSTSLALLRLGDSRCVDGLLGRGSGLTPVGDDVLAGWFVACHATSRDSSAVATATRSSAAHRTTAVSAALLDHAAAGECVPQLRALLRAVHSGRSPDTAFASLLAVGHTSGAGLALGVRLALHHPSVRSPRR